MERRDREEEPFEKLGTAPHAKTPREEGEDGRVVGGAAGDASPGVWVSSSDDKLAAARAARGEMTPAQGEGVGDLLKPAGTEVHGGQGGGGFGGVVDTLGGGDGGGGGGGGSGGGGGGDSGIGGGGQSSGGGMDTERSGALAERSTRLEAEVGRCRLPPGCHRVDRAWCLQSALEAKLR